MLEKTLQEMLYVSYLIKSNKQPRLELYEMRVYSDALKEFLMLNANHRLSMEYSTDSVYGAYNHLKDCFLNQQTNQYQQQINHHSELGVDYHIA